MSREVDPNKKNLSDDDKRYLAQRGELPADVMSVEDQRKLLDPDQAGPGVLELANTGTVATMTTEDLEAELERRRAGVEDDPSKLMTNPGGVAGASADDEDDEPLEPPYDQYGKAQLSGELQRRNAENELEQGDDGYLPLSGNKDELVARLNEDDASDEDDDSESE